jgi:hypothetical protein
MSIHQTYQVTATIGGESYLINSLAIRHTFGSAIPSASLVVSHDDYIFISSYANDLAMLPVITINVQVAGVINYTYHGVITNITGNENEVKLTNTLTVSPGGYYALIATSSFTGIPNVTYLTQPFTLVRDIIAYFNTSVFPFLSYQTSSGNPLVLTGPIYAEDNNLPLPIAPRFLGMSCMDMINAVARCYGLTAYLTWDNQVMIASKINPVRSDIRIAKNKMKSANYSLDIPMIVYSSASKEWPL